MAKNLYCPAAADSFPEFLESVMLSVENETANNNLNEVLLFKIKWMLIELCTNAYKHSAVFETEIDMNITTDKISIIKTDHSPQLPAFYIQLRKSKSNKIIIYSNPFDTLFAEYLQEDIVVLKVEKSNDTSNEILNFNEHFGLMIIAKSCSAFTYYFNKLSSTNVFTSVLNY